MIDKVSVYYGDAGYVLDTEPYAVYLDGVITDGWVEADSLEGRIRFIGEDYRYGLVEIYYFKE